MWPFRKKKIFKITWRHLNYSNIMTCADYVKAVDALVVDRHSEIINSKNKDSYYCFIIPSPCHI